MSRRKRDDGVTGEAPELSTGPRWSPPETEEEARSLIASDPLSPWAEPGDVPGHIVELLLRWRG